MLSDALGTLLQQKATRELLSNRTRRLPLSSRCLKKGFALLNTTWTGRTHTHSRGVLGLDALALASRAHAACACRGVSEA